MRDAVVGVGRLWVDHSPLGSVITIALPHLMVQGMAHYWSDVRIQMLLDSTSAQPIDCQKDQFVRPW